MSVPVSYCAFVKAVDDPKMMESLKRTMSYNHKHGAFTIVPCGRNPPCRQLTDEECEKLEQELYGD